MSGYHDIRRAGAIWERFDADCPLGGVTIIIPIVTPHSRDGQDAALDGLLIGGTVDPDQNARANRSAIISSGLFLKTRNEGSVS